MIVKRGDRKDGRDFHHYKEFEVDKLIIDISRF
jgi:hypothetical protein